jgi:hypothetical protein
MNSLCKLRKWQVRTHLFYRQDNFLSIIKALQSTSPDNTPNLSATKNDYNKVYNTEKKKSKRNETKRGQTIRNLRKIVTSAL